MSQLLQYYKSFQQSRNAAPTASPTIEDLSIDDKLTELQRLVKYAKSSIGLQRLVHVKKLAYTATTVGYSVTSDQILPLLDGFANDFEPAVKQQFAEQLFPLSKYCVTTGGEPGYQSMILKILPVIAKLLEDKKPEVRHAASAALVETSALVRAEDLGQYVLTIILRLAHEDDKEDQRMTATELLNMLAECLGQDLCRQFVIPEVVSLAEDPVFRVRKATALNFHNICKVGGEHELFERLMPAFVRLSKDDMYRVRRACADALPDISKYVSDDIRVGVLVEIFLRLTQDPSKLVKQSVLQQSGMFISTLPPRAVSEPILSYYCSMASGPTGDATADNELKHYCAFSFPAVLLTIGHTRWREIRSVYHSLVQSRNVNVKQTLAASLHVVAEILSKCGNSREVEDELVPVFEDMIQDTEVVQMGVMKNLAIFLSLLSEPCRVSYLPLLHDILHSTNPFNWRLRQSLAVQLPMLVRLPPKEEVYSILFPLVMTLLQDPVASVRRDSFKGVAALIQILSEQAENDPSHHSTSEKTLAEAVAAATAASGIGSPGGVNSGTEHHHHNHHGKAVPRRSRSSRSSHDLDNVIRTVNSLIKGETYQLRQLWVELARALLQYLPRSLFERHFVEGILRLTVDRVANVRVAVSIFLAGWDENDLPPWATEEEIQNASSFEEPSSLPTIVSSLSTTSTISSDSSSSSSSSLPTRRKLTPWAWLLRRPDVIQCVERLVRDDKDVYLNISKLQPLFPDLTFQTISCRGMKEPPGGSVPIPLFVSPVSSAHSSPANLPSTPSTSSSASLPNSPISEIKSNLFPSENNEPSSSSDNLSPSEASEGHPDGTLPATSEEENASLSEGEEEEGEDDDSDLPIAPFEGLSLDQHLPLTLPHHTPVVVPPHLPVGTSPPSSIIVDEFDFLAVEGVVSSEVGSSLLTEVELPIVDEVLMGGERERRAGYVDQGEEDEVALLAAIQAKKRQEEEEALGIFIPPSPPPPTSEI